MPDPQVKVLNEVARWRSRPVTYRSGKWNALARFVPEFDLADFVARDAPTPNPYLRAVIRRPLNTATEKPIPVGVVSPTYTLAQHTAIAQKCFAGLRNMDIEPKDLTCELGLTELGEWMNLRVLLGQRDHRAPPDGHVLGLRLECCNSVDGSSRLIVAVSWLRFVCSNGMMVWDAKGELRDIHNFRLDVDRIPEMVSERIGAADADLQRLAAWAARSVSLDDVECWVNGSVTKAWGKHAACRIFHICRSGTDVGIADRFDGAPASQIEVREPFAVPGAAKPAQNLYDASQALSWIATRRHDAEERMAWQSAIPTLIDNLRAQLN